MQYRSDLYLFLSCTRIDNAPKFSTISDIESIKSIELLEKTAREELDSVIYENIDRSPLGRIMLVCKDDDHHKPNFQEAFMFVTTYKKANIHMLTIVVADVKRPMRLSYSIKQPETTDFT